MLKALGTLDRRLALLMGLFVVLAFAMPAFEAHACPAETTPAFTATAALGDEAPACPDCGPACANGCCHAAHAAFPAEPAPVKTTLRPERAEPWVNVTRAPSIPHGGPERPPRS